MTKPTEADHSENTRSQMLFGESYLNSCRIRFEYTTTRSALKGRAIIAQGFNPAAPADVFVFGNTTTRSALKGQAIPAQGFNPAAPVYLFVFGNTTTRSALKGRAIPAQGFNPAAPVYLFVFGYTITRSPRINHQYIYPTTYLIYA